MAEACRPVCLGLFSARRRPRGQKVYRKPRIAMRVRFSDPSRLDWERRLGGVLGLGLGQLHQHAGGTAGYSATAVSVWSPAMAAIRS